MGVLGAMPLLTLGVTAAAALVAARPPAAELLEYDRAAIASGEIWRLFSFHLSHHSAPHLMLSLGHLVLLGGLCETWDRRRFVRGLAGVVMLVGPGLWVGAPLLERLPMVAPAFFDSLRGASALNAACFALLVVLVLEREASRPVRTATLAIAAGMLLAVAHETWAVLHGSAGALLPHPLGHALGASLGLLAGVAGPRP